MASLVSLGLNLHTRGVNTRRVVAGLTDSLYVTGDKIYTGIVETETEAALLAYAVNSGGTRHQSADMFKFVQTYGKAKRGKEISSEEALTLMQVESHLGDFELSKMSRERRPELAAHFDTSTQSGAVLRRLITRRWWVLSTSTGWPSTEAEIRGAYLTLCIQKYHKPTVRWVCQKAYLHRVNKREHFLKRRAPHKRVPAKHKDLIRGLIEHSVQETSRMIVK